MKDIVKGICVIVIIIVILGYSCLFGYIQGEPNKSVFFGIGQKTHRCEVSGKGHRCLKHSSRTYEKGCGCISNGVWIRYPNEYRYGKNTKKVH